MPIGLTPGRKKQWWRNKPQPRPDGEGSCIASNLSTGVRLSTEGTTQNIQPNVPAPPIQCLILVLRVPGGSRFPTRVLLKRSKARSSGADTSSVVKKPVALPCSVRSKLENCGLAPSFIQIAQSMVRIDAVAVRRLFHLRNLQPLRL